MPMETTVCAVVKIGLYLFALWAVFRLRTEIDDTNVVGKCRLFVLRARHLWQIRHTIEQVATIATADDGSIFRIAIEIVSQFVALASYHCLLCIVDGKHYTTVVGETGDSIPHVLDAHAVFRYWAPLMKVHTIDGSPFFEVGHQRVPGCSPHWYLAVYQVLTPWFDS